VHGLPGAAIERVLHRMPALPVSGARRFEQIAHFHSAQIELGEASFGFFELFQNGFKAGMTELFLDPVAPGYEKRGQVGESAGVPAGTEVFRQSLGGSDCDLGIPARGKHACGRGNELLAGLYLISTRGRRHEAEKRASPFEMFSRGMDRRVVMVCRFQARYGSVELIGGDRWYGLLQRLARA